MHLFCLTRWVSPSCPVIAIAFDFLLMTVIAFPGCAKSRINKFQPLFAWAMTFPFLINIIAAGLLRYSIPLLRSCPREIRLELHPGAKSTLYNSILSPSVSDIKTMPIFSVWMTCLADITKSLLLALVLLKRLRLLHK